MIVQDDRLKFTFKQANDYAWFLVALEKELANSFISTSSDFYVTETKDLNG